MATPIATRRVLFVPGFDPNPPRAHRERYRREGAAQAEISGYELTLAPDERRNAWQVTTRIDGQQCEAAIEVLVWSDLVRDAMGGGVFRVYPQLFRTTWTYLRHGTLFQLFRLRKGPVIAALYPVVMLLAQAVLAVGLGLVVAYGALAASEIVTNALEGTGSVQSYFQARALGVLFLWPLVSLWLLRWFKCRDGVFLARYLMQDYAFAASAQGAPPPPLAARLAIFTDHVIEAAQGPEDELLVVGHSSGADLAVSILADALRSGAISQDKRLALLTLGHVVPMVSFLPAAVRLRRDLAYLAVSDRITWVDVTAPGDGCCFALCDPVAVTGVAPADKRWPLVISAAFSQTLSSATQARLRRRFFRLHFQYMCAFDRPGDYDFFAISAGPKSLAARFADRAPSPSRVETAVNPFAGHT